MQRAERVMHKISRKDESGVSVLDGRNTRIFEQESECDVLCIELMLLLIRIILACCVS